VTCATCELSGNAREWLDCPGTDRNDPCIQTSSSYDKKPFELSCSATKP